MVEFDQRCGIISGVVALLLGIYIWGSFATLEQTEMGIDFNAITYKTGDVYFNGRQFIGFGHYFIKFPTNLQTIEFSADKSGSDKRGKGDALRSRTLDGLEVLLEVSFQYRLEPGANGDQIKAVFAKFGEDYESVYVPLAVDTITRKATDYNANTFFSDRTLVGEGIEQEIMKVFKEQALCSIEFFQLRSVSLPRDFEVAIQTTEVKKQDIKTAEAERGNRKIAGQTMVKQAEQESQAILYRADAAATTIQLNVDAYVEQFNISQGLQATAFAELYKTLGSDEARLLEYMDVRALRDHPSAGSVISLKTATT